MASATSFSWKYTVCMFSSWTASLWILGSLPWTSFPEICQYDSDAVMNHKLTISFYFIRFFGLCIWTVIQNITLVVHNLNGGHVRAFVYIFVQIFTWIYCTTYFNIYMCIVLFEQVRIVWHYVSVVEGHSIFHNIFAIISSPILRIAITLHCYFCEIFRKLLCTFAILHAWRIRISYTTGSVHHELCDNLIQFREYVFVWNFCTNYSHSQLLSWACLHYHICLVYGHEEVLTSATQ